MVRFIITDTMIDFLIYLKSKTTITTLKENTEYNGSSGRIW
jgi:hypothetical protein